MFFRKTKNIYRKYNILGYQLVEENALEVPPFRTTSPSIEKTSIAAALMNEFIGVWLTNELKYRNQKISDLVKISEVGESDSLLSIIATTDFPQLTNENSTRNFEWIFTTFKDSKGDHSGARLVDTYTRVLTFVDYPYLLDVANRFYYSMEQVEDTEVSNISWPEIHERFPMMWFIWCIQQVIAKRISETQ